MAEHTAITWCDSTFNPWVGCTKVSPACDHCYAERLMDHRIRRVQWGAGHERKRTSASNWRQPLAWNSKRFMQCEDCGWRGEAATPIVGCGGCGSVELSDTRRRVFCASLADVFDNEVDPKWRADLFALIEATPNLDWLVLTKRVGNAQAMLDDAMLDLSRGSFAWTDEAALSNVWLGATICDQDEADRDVPKLMATQAAVRFLSIEPMLGDIRLGSWLQRSPSAAFAAGLVTADMPAWARIGATAIDWVICGGESGPLARPMHPDWVRSLRDQCAAAGVPFHFKQWGEWTPGENVARQRGIVEVARLWDDQWDRWNLNLTTDHGHIDDQPDLYRVGTKAAGRLLDGVEHNGFPASA